MLVRFAIIIVINIDLSWFAGKSMQSTQSATTPRILTLIEIVDRVVHAGTFCNHHRHQYWLDFPENPCNSPQNATTPRILTLTEPVDRVVHAGTFCNHHRHQYWPGLPHWQQKEGCRGLRQFSLKEFIINSLCLGRRPLFTWAERFTIVAIYYALHSVGLFLTVLY